MGGRTRSNPFGLYSATYISGMVFMISARTLAIIGWIFVLAGAAMAYLGSKDENNILLLWGIGIGFQFFAGFVHFFRGGEIDP